MLYFPQMSSGAAAQYPVKKSVIQRTITNTLPDGRTVKYVDPGGDLVQWRLGFQQLADSEVMELQDFFAACEGQLHQFVFADPVANLIVWSEDLTQSQWQADASLVFTTGVTDPNGGTSATQITNPTGADLMVQQTIAAPGWYSYAFSTYLKNQSAGSATLIRQAGGITNAQAFVVNPAWRRVALSGQTSTTGESVTVGITIPAGQSVTVFGLQLEPQPAPSPYKPSYDNGGIYTNAHFTSDTFEVTTNGPNRNQCTLTVIAH